MKMGGTLLLTLLVALVGAPSMAQWLVGQDGTVGGNSPGRNCVFPFIYKGQQYNECITNDNGFNPWCATTSNYDNEKQWARCKITIFANRTRNGNAGKSSCNLPFTYKNNVYHNCTTEQYDPKTPWCATSSDFGRDKRWAECVRYPDVNTTGGNVPAGTPCNFPYTYRGGRFHGCITTENQGIGWCSVTDSYDVDGLWGNCVITTLSQSSSACPNGNTYTGPARSTLSYGGVGKPNADTLDKCKGECDMDSSCIGFDFDTNPGANRCYIHTSEANFAQKETVGVTSVDQYTLQERCAAGSSGSSSGVETGKPVTTRGGNAGPSGRCSFPFRYNGHDHVSCISARWYTPWCATVPDYDAEKMWGECANIPTL